MHRQLLEDYSQVVVALINREYRKVKIGVHFYFEKHIARRVFNFQGRTMAYDKPRNEEFVISPFIIDTRVIVITLTNLVGVWSKSVLKKIKCTLRYKLGIVDILHGMS